MSQNFGVFGLGVMGASLAKNIERRGVQKTTMYRSLPRSRYSRTISRALCNNYSVACAKCPCPRCTFEYVLKEE